MGRKSNSKQKKNREERKQYPEKQKLFTLIQKLLSITSTFQASTNTVKSWDHHLEIESILAQIKDIENFLFTDKYNSKIPSQEDLDVYLNWLRENGAQFDGVDICEFEGYGRGLKATKQFQEGSLILTVPTEIMLTEEYALKTELNTLVNVDPLLQNMPNIALALYLLLEKVQNDQKWRPYLQMMPEKYSTVLYYTAQELNALRPSPVFDSALKLRRSIARQYAYLHLKMHSYLIPVTKDFQKIFTYENYRWAVSTVMTRQNKIRLGERDVTAFIPLWDMCNHEQGKITTDYNKELNRGECYALRDFNPGDQVFIFYGARPNSDLLLHNGFVYPNNQHDTLSLVLGVSSGDPMRETRLSLLSKLGLAAVTHYSLYPGDMPVSPELLAFIRIFSMNQEELTKWSSKGVPCDLVSSDAANSAIVGADIDRRAYNYLLTRCRLLKASYKKGTDKKESNKDGVEPIIDDKTKTNDNESKGAEAPKENGDVEGGKKDIKDTGNTKEAAENGEVSKPGFDQPNPLHSKSIELLKESEVQILDGAIKYLENTLKALSAA